MEVNIICLVGVIGSGKDYFVETYKKEHPKEGVFEIKIGSTLTKIASNIYGVDLSNKELYEKWKYEGNNRIKLITLAESIKLYLGKNIFATQAVRKIADIIREEESQENNKIITFIISDSCFPNDIETVCDTLELFYLNTISAFVIYGDGTILLDRRIHFCNFKSPRYSIKKDQPREQFPIFLIDQGFADGTEWSYEEFTKVIDLYNMNLSTSINVK